METIAPNKEDWFKAQQERMYASEANTEKERLARIERMHPPIRVMFDRLTLRNQPAVKDRVVKRLRIATGILSTTTLGLETREPSMELALIILGRAHAVNLLLNDINMILQEATNSRLDCLPRETWQLQQHIREEIKLAEQMVKAIGFNSIKEVTNESNGTTQLGGTLPTTVPGDSGNVEAQRSGN